MSQGVFEVHFRSNIQDFGSGLVFVKDGSVNGSDANFLYQGKLPAQSGEFKTQINVQQWQAGTGSAIQSISRLTHSSLIGMSETPFQIFQRLCDDLVLRAPSLLQRPSYRCRNGDTTAVPFELWLAIVRHAREHFDPAGLDADFLVAKMREGRSSREAFDALIASKRPK